MRRWSLGGLRNVGGRLEYAALGIEEDSQCDLETSGLASIDVGKVPRTQHLATPQ